MKRPTGKLSFSGFFKLIGLTKPKYSLFVIGLTAGIIGTILQLIVPKMIRPLIDGFSKGINYGILGKVVGVYIIAMLLGAVGAAILGFFGESVVKNLRQNIWDKLVHLYVKYFDQIKIGEINSRLVNDTSQVKDFLAKTVPQTLSSLLLLLGSIVMMWRMDWHMTVAMVVVVPVAAVLITPLAIFGSRIGRMRQDALADFSGNANEVLSEIRLVKSSNGEKQASMTASTNIQKLYRIGLKEAIFDGSMQPIMMLLMMTTIFGLLAYGIHRVAVGAMAIGTLMSFLMYLMNLIGSVPVLGMFFTDLSKAAGSTERLNELLVEDQEHLNDGRKFDVEGQSLTAEHVDFSYDTGDQILHDVSFKAEPNTIVAFAGPSGGGKSTIFSLLERFYEPTAGQITIGDLPIEAVSLHDWRSQIGFVSQDSAIMAGTIRDNLTYGLDGEFSDDQLWHVLELAFARNFVEQMPAKLNTQVGERGVKISGGQRQRIAIARAFLRDPKILMLDEATASLDSESEAMVQKALDTLMQGRTTLVIAHRLSTIVDADNIYFIENGQVTGSGKHSDLVASHPLYAQYVAEQLTVGN
ncbi:multidrug ABC transporter ATP-binding protein [Weissella oryzae SG25]|uniref:Multidrug resistance ABC transporter ATP-binding and permease protein n=2 Tax=Weissella TaxID=46255 RepID=A0A069CTY9_WEIOS|nr:multidrug ABC transporter ATP-binding protein [Weissella oryzae SG25]